MDQDGCFHSPGAISSSRILCFMENAHLKWMNRAGGLAASSVACFSSRRCNPRTVRRLPCTRCGLSRCTWPCSTLGESLLQLVRMLVTTPKEEAKQREVNATARQQAIPGCHVNDAFHIQTHQQVLVELLRKPLAPLLMRKS